MTNTFMLAGEDGPEAILRCLPRQIGVADPADRPYDGQRKLTRRVGERRASS